MGFILQSDYVFSDFTSQGLDKVPVNARVRVGLYTYVLVKEGASATTTIQEGIDGGYIVSEQNDTKKETNILSRNMYLLVPSSSSNPDGDLRIRCYDNNGNLTCSFTLAMLGISIEEFRITKCVYSKDLKSNRISSQYGGLFYGGFGLQQNSDGIYFSVLDNSKCGKIIVEYSDCNFVPPLSSIGVVIPSSTNKIYAIREGGGTWIQDLGVIKSDYRANGNNALGETLDFYLFSNGFVRWTSAITLDSNYFHQWANGGFGSLNIDASDKVLCNVGTTTGQSLGVIASASLPNIKGKACVGGDVGTYGTTGMIKDSSATSAVQGAFYADSVQTRWHTEYDERYRARALAFSANLSDSTYQDNAKVNMERIPNFLVVQAF